MSILAVSVSLVNQIALNSILTVTSVIVAMVVVWTDYQNDQSIIAIVIILGVERICEWWFSDVVRSQMFFVL